MKRRTFLSLGAAAGASSLTGCTLQSTETTTKTTGTRIALEPVVEGLHFPTSLSWLPTGDRLVTDRAGVVQRVTDDGVVEEPFLDLRDRMAELRGERGLLGLAIHPNFDENRRFFVRYSAPLRESMPDDYSHTAVLSEFEATADGTSADPSSERIVLEIPQPGVRHQSGDVAFGPDGYLYVPLGDGEGYDVNDVESWYWWNAFGDASQNTTENLLGGILRIDVDETAGDRGYGIPSDNPLVGRDGRDEYYAWGLRNPYRISFDRGRLFVTDVGLGSREEVNVVEAGGNYGWPVREGRTCARNGVLTKKLGESPLNALHPKVWLATFNLLSPYRLCPSRTDRGEPLRDPVVDYHRGGSRAVVGGYVYRGDAIPALEGAFIFGDFIAPAPIFAAKPPRRRPDANDESWTYEELVVEDGVGGRLSDSILSFARGPEGDVYVLSTRFEEGSGAVQQITAPSG